MIIPTRIDPSLFSDFVQQVGGVEVARRILAVTGKQVTQWCDSVNAPQLALKLLWTATPAGVAAQDESSHDLYVRLREQVRCLTDDLARERAHRDHQLEAATAEQQRLQIEVQRLKFLLHRPGLSTVLNRLASELNCIADATRLTHAPPAAAFDQGALGAVQTDAMHLSALAKP